MAPPRGALLWLGGALLLCQADAATQQAQANPLRKVVTLLQNMAKETEEEGVKAKELFDKFLCYCQTNTKDLTTSIEEAQAHITELEAGIKELSGSNAQLEQEIKDLNDDLAESTKAVDEATAQRQSEASAYSAEASETTNNIGSLDKAIPALKAGLESPGQALAQLSSVVNRAPAGQASMLQGLMQGQQVAAGSDQIVGILEQMRDDMKANLQEMTQAEQEAIDTFNQLTGAKKKQIAAASEEINEKTGRLTLQKQQQADFEEDFEDTSKALAADEEFKISLTKTCKEKTEEDEAATKARNEELVAIGEAIKILNDDESLELFKKTLPSPEFVQSQSVGFSFVQVGMRSRAKWQLESAAEALGGSGVNGGHGGALGLLALQMRAEARRRQPADFGPLKTAVSGMISDLSSEQADDDAQLDQCKKDIGMSEGEKSGLESTLTSQKSKMDALNVGITGLQDEMKILKTEIAELDAAMKTATEQREKEKTTFNGVMADLSISSSLLVKAKSVLERVFAPKPEASLLQQSGTWESSLSSFLAVGQEQPATATYERKTGGGMGVLNLLDQLNSDIKMQQQQEEMTESQAQKDYEDLSAKTATSKESKEKDMVSKEEASSKLQEELMEVKKEADETKSEHGSVEAKLAALHSGCDFLLGNYDERKKARAEEVESLRNSLAVLSGAVLEPPAALLQVAQSRHHVGRHLRH